MAADPRGSERDEPLVARMEGIDGLLALWIVSGGEGGSPSLWAEDLRRPGAAGVTTPAAAGPGAAW